ADAYLPILTHFHPPSTWYISRILQIDLITGRLDLCHSLIQLGLSQNCSELNLISTSLNYALQLNTKNLLEVSIQDLVEFSGSEFNYWYKLSNYLGELKEYTLITKIIQENINTLLEKKQLEPILISNRGKLNYSELIPSIKSQLLNNLNLNEFNRILSLIGEVNDTEIQFLQIQIQIIILIAPILPNKPLSHWLECTNSQALQKELFDSLIYNELDWDSLINVLESPFLTTISNEEKYKLILNTFSEPAPQLDIWLETNEFGEELINSLTFEFVDDALKLSNPQELQKVLKKSENWLSYLNVEVPEVIRKLELIQGLSLLNEYCLRLGIVIPDLKHLLNQQENLSANESDLAKMKFIEVLFQNNVSKASTVKLYLEEKNLLKLSYLLSINAKNPNFTLKLNTLLVSNALQHKDFSFAYRLVISKFNQIIAKTFELNAKVKEGWSEACLNLIKQSPRYSLEERRLVLGWTTSLSTGPHLRECLELGKSLNAQQTTKISNDHPMYWTPLATTRSSHQELINEAYFPPSGVSFKVMEVANGKDLEQVKDTKVRGLLKDLDKGLENAPKWFKLANDGKLKLMKFKEVEVPQFEEETVEDEEDEEEETQPEDNDGWGDEIGDLEVNDEDDGEGGWGDEIGDLDLNPTEEKHSSPLQVEEEVDAEGWGDEIGDLGLDNVEEEHTSPLQAEEEIDAGGWDDEIGDLEIDNVADKENSSAKVDKKSAPKADTNVDTEGEDGNNGWDDELDLDLPTDTQKLPEPSTTAEDNEEQDDINNSKSNDNSKLTLEESYPTPEHIQDNSNDSELLTELLPNFAKLPIEALISIGQIPL
ncbi:hypothetical protein CONCODRAFT_12739, partial [Conidiobolus coronatus NRRL 28638]